MLESMELEPAAEAAELDSVDADAMQRDMDGLFDAALTEAEKSAQPEQPLKKRPKASPKASPKSGTGRLGIAQAKATARSSGSGAAASGSGARPA